MAEKFEFNDEQDENSNSMMIKIKDFNLTMMKK